MVQDAMVSLVFILFVCLESTLGKYTRMRAVSAIVVVIFSESAILKVTWSQVYFLSQQLRGTMTTVFWKRP